MDSATQDLSARREQPTHSPDGRDNAFSSLRLRRASLPAHRGQNCPSQSPALEHREDESCFISKRSSLPAVLAKLSSQTDCCTHGSIDSGYASASTRSEGSTPKKSHENPHSNPFRRKVTKLRPFNKPMTQSTHKRFQDLLTFIDEPLRDFVTAGGLNYSGLAMQLITLGETEETAKPWIVVQCDRTISKKVRQFLTQPQIRCQYESSHDDLIGMPHMDIVVCNRPPRTMAAASGYIWDYRGLVEEHPPGLCGKVFQVPKDNGDKQNRLATIGGCIQVTHSDGTDKLYGITVKHVFDVFSVEHASTGACRPEEENVLESYESEDNTDGEVEVELDVDFEPEIGQSESNQLAPASTRPSIRAACTMPTDKEPISNLDWALLEVPNDLDLRNYLILEGRSHVLSRSMLESASFLSNRPTAPVFSRPVLQWNCLSGLKKGVLKFYSASLALAPGMKIVRVHELWFANDQKLSPGDCGSWIIDQEKFTVYGHVVASGVFGNAFVVPLQSTFDDIEDQLGAKEVRIALHSSTTPQGHLSKANITGALGTQLGGHRKFKSRNSIQDSGYASASSSPYESRESSSATAEYGSSPKSSPEAPYHLEYSNKGPSSLGEPFLRRLGKWLQRQWARRSRARKALSTHSSHTVNPT